MDWIKYQKTTLQKREVTIIAASLCTRPQEVVGMCVQLWSWVDSESTTGIVPGYTAAMVDSLVGCPGFANALESVGWLRVRESGIEIPNFERHMGASAKQRLLSKERSKSYRERSSGVTQASRKKRDASSLLLSSLLEDWKPGEEEIPWFRGARFSEAWDLWVAHRTENRKPPKPTGARTLLKRLAAMGEERAVAALEHSIANGWTGVFEPAAEKPAKSPVKDIVERTREAAKRLGL